MRRSRVFYTGDDVQMLKSGQVIPFVRCTPDFQILTSSNYVHKKEMTPELWAKFESQDMTGIDVLGFIRRHDRELANCHSCSFSLYSISKNSAWNESFILTKTGVKNSLNQWTINFTKAEIGLDLCCADVTFKIQASFLRLGKTYRKTIYVNHLGISESVCFAHNKIQFLELTKKDE